MVTPDAPFSTLESYRALFEALDDGFCLMELAFDEAGRPVDYRFLETNAAFERHTGLVDAVGKTARELVPNLDDSWFELYGAVALTGASVRLENHAPAMNRWFEVFASRFGPAEARQVALVFKDISRRKQAEAERSAALARVTEVLESMGDVFCVFDREWRFVQVNSSHERIVGKPRSETLGRVVWELFPEAAAPGSKYWDELHRCMDERVAVQFVEHYAPLDLWSDTRAYPTVEGIAVFGRDVSEEKRAEAALKRQAEFEQQLVGIVSHDLRNPIAAIGLTAATLLKRNDLDERAVSCAARIASGADRAERLIRDLLDCTQARSGLAMPVARKSLQTAMARGIGTVTGSRR